MRDLDELRDHYATADLSDEIERAVWEDADLDALLGEIKPSPWPLRLYYRTRRWTPRQLRRKVRWGVQRWRRGYSDRDVWDFDHYLAQIIPPAMRQLSHELHGVPCTIAARFDSIGDREARMQAAVSEWRRILEAVAVGFDAWSTIGDEYPKGERLAELTRQWEEGSRLLVEHFGAFWD